MLRGKVARFPHQQNPRPGSFGFIEPDNGGPDVHFKYRDARVVRGDATAFTAAKDTRIPKEGDAVCYEIAFDEKNRPCAAVWGFSPSTGGRETAR